MAASAGELPCFRPDGRQRFVVIQTAPADGPDHRHRLRYAPHGNRRKRPPATHRRGARHGRNTRVGALPDTIYRTGGRFGHRRGQAFEDERCPVGNDALRAAARGAVAPYLPLDRGRPLRRTVHVGDRPPRHARRRPAQNGTPQPRAGGQNIGDDHPRRFHVEPPRRTTQITPPRLPRRLRRKNIEPFR